MISDLVKYFFNDLRDARLINLPLDGTGEERLEPQPGQPLSYNYIRPIIATLWANMTWSGPQLEGNVIPVFTSKISNPIKIEELGRFFTGKTL